MTHTVAKQPDNLNPLPSPRQLRTELSHRLHPAPTTDLDCKDIPDKRFTVLPPDPHKFDSDKDGIGCGS